MKYTHKKGLVYKCSKLYAVISVILIAAGGFAFIFYFWLYDYLFAPKNPLPHRVPDNMIWMGLLLGVIAVIGYIPVYFSRYVELNDKYVNLHGYRIPGKTKSRQINIMYSNIYQLEYKKKLGLFECIRIYEKSLPKPVTVSFIIRGHKELYAELSVRVQRENPKAYIDKRLLKSDGERQ